VIAGSASSASHTFFYHPSPGLSAGGFPQSFLQPRLDLPELARGLFDLAAELLGFGWCNGWWSATARLIL
jgi:hypothetical protein